jgi:hypothetical protein
VVVGSLLEKKWKTVEFTKVDFFYEVCHCLDAFPIHSRDDILSSFVFVLGH